MGFQTDQDFLWLKPTSDLFIAVFLSAAKNEHLLRGIINAVLKDKSGWKPIEKAVVLNPLSITNYAIDKRTSLDVRVSDSSGAAFNIEIQTYPHPAFRERILHGWSNSYSSQLPTGAPYAELKPVITIVITEFPVFPKSKKVHLVFNLREYDDPTLVMSEHIQIHFWQLHEVMREHHEVLDEVSPDLAHWSQFFALGSRKSEVEMSILTENDPYVMEAYYEFQRFISDPEAREYARRRHSFEIDHQMREKAAKDEGKAEAEKEWRDKVAESEEKRREAEERWREEEKKRRADKIETARKFKLLGVDRGTIAQATGLSLEEIEHLN